MHNENPFTFLSKADYTRMEHSGIDTLKRELPIISGQRRLEYGVLWIEDDADRFWTYLRGRRWLVPALIKSGGFAALPYPDILTKKDRERYDRLMPPTGTLDDERVALRRPRWIRCYDNGGKTIDRYTVVYTGNYNNIGRPKRGTYYGGTHIYVVMSSNPTSFTGVGQHGESYTPIDYPSYEHLGKKIDFFDLPDDCQRLVLWDYHEIWNLNTEEEHDRPNQ